MRERKAEIGGTAEAPVSSYYPFPSPEGEDIATVKTGERNMRYDCRKNREI